MDVPLQRGNPPINRSVRRAHTGLEIDCRNMSQAKSRCNISMNLKSKLDFGLSIIASSSYYFSFTKRKVVIISTIVAFILPLQDRDNHAQMAIQKVLQKAEMEPSRRFHLIAPVYLWELVPFPLRRRSVPPLEQT